MILTLLINQAKVILATELTKLIHGENEALRARDQAQSLFSVAGGKDAPEIFIEVPAGLLTVPIVDVLVLAKICESKGEARRLIATQLFRLIQLKRA